MTDFLRVPEHAEEPEDKERDRRRSYPDQRSKVDPTVLQVARRLARGAGAVQPRVTRPESPSTG